jgi:hypothetical protein
MKTGPDSLGTAENDFGRAKHENWTRHPPYCEKLVRECKIRKREPATLVPPKVSPGTVENETGRANRENDTRKRVLKTCPGAQNMKMGFDALRTAKNMSGSGKHENGIGRPRHRRKRVRVCKT